MVTIFTCPRPFEGHTGTIQRNALISWAHLWPHVDVNVLGDEYGAMGIAMQLRFGYLPKLKRDMFGTPLVSDVFEQGESHCEDDVIAYVNSDIILMDDFVRAAGRAERAFPGPFLMVGQRTDLDLTESLFFSAGWEDRLRTDAKQRGTLHQPAGIDYFVYRKGTLGEIPAFALGRWRWDNWIVWSALLREVPVIDATECVLAIHQNHDHSHHGAEGAIQRSRNDTLVQLTGGHLCTIDHATHRMSKESIKKN